MFWKIFQFSFQCLKARGWWPRNRSSTKIFFWRFVFLWVNSALLNPIKSFSWRGCEVQATTSKEESCSFLDAIGRRSCGPLGGLANNRHVGKPNLRLKRIETAGRYATVRFVTLLWLALQLMCESHLSLLFMHIVGHATESEVHASGKFCSISDPPPPSLSPCDQIREKESQPLTRQSEHPSESSLNVVTRSPGLPQLACSGWFKRKNAELFAATSSCVDDVLWISNDLRRVAALGNYMLSDATFNLFTPCDILDVTTTQKQNSDSLVLVSLAALGSCQLHFDNVSWQCLLASRWFNLCFNKQQMFGSGPLGGLANNRHVGKPNLRLKRIETAGWYATVRFVTLLWLALQLMCESHLSLLFMHIVGHATESEVHASGKFCSISDPPPPPLSLRVTRFEKKNHNR